MATLTIITQNLDGYYWTYGKRNSERLYEKILLDINSGRSAGKKNKVWQVKDESLYEEFRKEMKEVEMSNPDLSEKEIFLEVIKKRYMEDDEAKADIYAFQEVSKLNNRHWSNITETIVKNPQFKKNTRDADCAEEIWYKAFPWNEFRSGYWDECDVEFAGNKIKIINFHSGPRYDLAIRYTLLKRLSEIQDRETILLGDFNAAFRYQTQPEQDESIIEGEDFLKEITRKYRFIECKNSDEHKGKVQYTHFYYDTSKAEKTDKISNKLDHIFISKSLFRKLQKPYIIEYIHKVRRDYDLQQNESDKAFTDHSGIKLTIWLPDPEADSKQAKAPAP